MKAFSELSLRIFILYIYVNQSSMLGIVFLLKPMLVFVFHQECFTRVYIFVHVIFHCVNTMSLLGFLRFPFCYFSV